MNTSDTLQLIAIGGILGIIGQIIRFIVGMKKLKEDKAEAQQLNERITQANATANITANAEMLAPIPSFSNRQFGISLLIGMSAGIIAALFSQEVKQDKAFFAAIIAAGYAGADFIEGFMSKIIGKNS
jgi:hypothetical protein